jgi:hypothetical protein
MLTRTPKLFERGWMFPCEAGTLRVPSTLDKTWSA